MKNQPPTPRRTPRLAPPVRYVPAGEPNPIFGPAAVITGPAGYQPAQPAGPRP